MGRIGVIFSLLALNIILCYGFPWHVHQPIPLELREIAEDYEVETTTEIKDVRTFEELMDKDDFFDLKEYGVRVKFSKMVGGSCSKPTDPIVINKLTLPDVIVFGENATFSSDITIKENIPNITLAKVVVVKVGSITIPCIDNIGSCDYNNPCALLEKFPCPPAIVKAGWNCRCPLAAKHFAPGPITVHFPTIPLPAFLVDGQYDITVHMFNGDEELICYKITMTMKKESGRAEM